MAQSAMLSSAKGHLQSCGPDATPSVSFTCSGPSCAAMKGFAGSTCTLTDDGSLSCSNGVTCPQLQISSAATLSSTFNFTQQNNQFGQSNPVAQVQVLMLNSCPALSLTSDGTAAGTSAKLSSSLSQAATLKDAGSCNGNTGGGQGAVSSGSSGSGSSSITSSGPSSGSNAGSPLSTAASSTKPVSPLFTGSASRKPTGTFAWICTILLAFGLFAQGAVALQEESTHQLDTRQASAFTQFANNFRQYAIAQLSQNGEPAGSAQSSANKLVDAVGSAVCGSNLPSQQSVAMLAALVENCVDAVYSGALPMNASSEFLLVFGGSILCNFAVTEVFTNLGGVAGVSDKIVCNTLSSAVSTPVSTTVVPTTPQSTSPAATTPAVTTTVPPPSSTPGVSPSVVTTSPSHSPPVTTPSPPVVTPPVVTPPVSPPFSNTSASATTSTTTSTTSTSSTVSPCPSAQSLCAGTCTDLQESSSNCGACGNECGNGTVCRAGVCVPGQSCTQPAFDDCTYQPEGYECVCYARMSASAGKLCRANTSCNGNCMADSDCASGSFCFASPCTGGSNCVPQDLVNVCVNSADTRRMFVRRDGVEWETKEGLALLRNRLGRIFKRVTEW